MDLHIAHPFAMLAFLVLTCISFSLLGFIIGIWAGNFEQLQLVPLLIVTPLVFLGGTFYSITMLPAFWQTVALFNPVVYLISGFRWSFFEQSDVPVGAVPPRHRGLHGGLPRGVWWIFRTGLAARALSPLARWPFALDEAEEGDDTGAGRALQRLGHAVQPGPARVGHAQARGDEHAPARKAPPLDPVRAAHDQVFGAAGRPG